MVRRTDLLAGVTELLARFPVVGLIGARQVGKTTLARALAAERGAVGTFFDLDEAHGALHESTQQFALDGHAQESVLRLTFAKKRWRFSSTRSTQDLSSPGWLQGRSSTSRTTRR